MKINLLGSDVYNLIAAGEVVERPSSVVKELIENSIDAGATAVRIAIRYDGDAVTLLEVSDNGCGMSAEDLKLSYLPHATSKISSANDLELISTLGFRGEALASISSVSQFEIDTRNATEDCSSILTIDTDRLPTYTVGARPRGTTVRVKNLFFNTPARYKFLKSGKVEVGYVTNAVAKQILANPTIAFEYSVNDKSEISADGKGLESAVIAVYGKDYLKNMLPVENTVGNICVSGYVSTPDYSKPNRTYQSFIVNGRCVESQNLTVAVEKAYMGYLMKRNYPAFVLNILVPFDTIDVNVHPSKTEVRFQNQNAVFGAVYKAVLKAIEERSSKQYDRQLFDDESKNNEDTVVSGDTKPNDEQTSAVDNSRKSEDFEQILKNARILANSLSKNSQRTSFRDDSHYVSAENDDKQTETKQETEEKIDVTEVSTATLQYTAPFIPDFDCKIVGQLFSTYAIYQQGDSAYLVDQHAAHERLLYDELLKNLEDKAVQPLLVPYIRELNYRESELLEQLIPELCAIGFDIESFGRDAVKISAVPLALTEINFDRLFAYLFENMSGGVPKLKDMLFDKLCMTACRAAIKGGNPLTEAQLAYFVANMRESGGNDLKCPHGRPAIYRFTKKDIEKLFKRLI